MVNTYKCTDSIFTKIHEEMRCTRAVLERILTVMDRSAFVDYQMEKFGKDYKTTIEKVRNPKTVDQDFLVRLLRQKRNKLINIKKEKDWELFHDVTELEEEIETLHKQVRKL